MTEKRVAIVTGAARGIGRVSAEALARSGFALALLDQDESGARRAAATLDAGALAIGCDISNLASHDDVLARVVKHFGRIDCLVNNAGIASPVRGDLLVLSPENFDRVLAVNLRGTVFLTQKIARWMVVNPSPEDRAIVTVTSISAGVVSLERLDYCIAKAGLAMFVRGLALRLAPHRIAVFEVRPGIIRTEMTRAAAPAYERLIADGTVPARRWGEPADVGSVIAGLASGTFYATGSVLNVDGGLGIARL